MIAEEFELLVLPGGDVSASNTKLQTHGQFAFHTTHRPSCEPGTFYLGLINVDMYKTIVEPSESPTEVTVVRRLKLVTSHHFTTTANC